MPTGKLTHGEAIRLECGDSVPRATVLAVEWADVPKVSTGELVRALRRAGFGARLVGPDHVMLLRDGVDAAYVPLEDAIHPAILMAVLRAVGLSLDRLLEFMAAREY